MFGRNIGNITSEEQEKLRHTTIAIAGTGGVGGSALLNLARIGIGSLKIADPEVFSYSDINRQQGSGHNSSNIKKTKVLHQALKSINPHLNIEEFPEGLTEENLEKFLSSTSIVIDGLDFFCLKIRKKLFEACRKKGLYILSCPIFGFGASLAVFSPRGLSFDEFFGPIPEKPDMAYAVNFGRLFFPAFPKYIDLKSYIEAMKKRKPIPSFATSCALSGAVAAAEAIFIILNRKKPLCIPHIRHYDLFEGRVTIKNSRKKLNFLEKTVLKLILSRNKELRPFRYLIDKF